MTLPGMMAAVGAPAHAVTALEDRKLPMQFTWVACEPNCRGWIAVGIVTGETSKTFDEFARGRDLGGATILSLNVPPRENLHELSPRELQLTGLVTTDAVADELPESGLINSTVASLTLKPAHDRLVGSADDDKIPPGPKSTRTAEAAVPTGEVMAVAPAPK